LFSSNAGRKHAMALVILVPAHFLDIARPRRGGSGS
jgi:hypothetical protein